MNQNEYIQLKKIFNTMKLVHTSAEDTIYMSECLKAFNALLENVEIDKEE